MTRYALSKYLDTTAYGSEYLIVEHRLNGQRLRLKRSDFSKLSLALLKGDRDWGSTLTKFIRAGLVVPWGSDELSAFHQDSLFQYVGTTFTRCPLFVKGCRSDLVIVGAPYSSNHNGEIATKTMADVLRQYASKLTYADRGDGTHGGWFERESGKSCLQGVSFADAGNIKFCPGEDPETFFARMDRAIQLFMAEGAIPITLGGDHSITYGGVRALARKSPIHLIQLDAHEDADEYRSGMGTTHNNFVTRLKSENLLASHHVIGLRGLARAWEKNRYPNYRSQPQEILEELCLVIGLGEPVYLSIDMDCLNPLEFPYVSYPELGGFSLTSLKNLSRFLSSKLAIVAVDITEYRPDLDPTKIGCAMLLELCFAIMEGLTL